MSASVLIGCLAHNLKNLYSLNSLPTRFLKLEGEKRFKILQKKLARWSLFITFFGTFHFKQIIASINRIPCTVLSVRTNYVMSFIITDWRPAHWDILYFGVQEADMVGLIYGFTIPPQKIEFSNESTIEK